MTNTAKPQRHEQANTKPMAKQKDKIKSMRELKELYMARKGMQ